MRGKHAVQVAFDLIDEDSNGVIERAEIAGCVPLRSFDACDLWPCSCSWLVSITVILYRQDIEFYDVLKARWLCGRVDQELAHRRGRDRDSRTARQITRRVGGAAGWRRCCWTQASARRTLTGPSARWTKTSAYLYEISSVVQYFSSYRGLFYSCMCTPEGDAGGDTPRGSGRNRRN